jgi:peptidoglycan/LPS O-acetylase OafA/YrhL
VLSGFLITGILLDAKGSPHVLRSFYARRVLRIFPLYYSLLFMLFVVLPFMNLGSSTSPDGSKATLWVWTYLTNFRFTQAGGSGIPSSTTHLWSVAVEEQFYLFWPFVVLLTNRRQLLWVCLSAVVVAWFSRLGLFFATGNGRGGYSLLVTRMDALAVGAALSTLVRSEVGPQLLARWAKPALGGSLVLILCGIAITLATTPSEGVSPMHLHVQLLIFPATALLSSALLLMSLGVPEAPAVHRFLTSRWLMNAGKYSYALYLLHVPIRDFIAGRFFAGHTYLFLGSQLPAAVLTILFGSGVSYAVAWMSWRVIESPALSLKRFFPYSASARGATEGIQRHQAVTP